MLDYFIFYSILVSFSVIFRPFFAMNKRRCTDEAENSSFIRMCTCSLFKRKQKWKTDYQHVISSKKSSGNLISVSALTVHFYIYLYFSLNGSLFVFFSLRLARFHYKNCKNTKQSLRFRNLFFLPNLFSFMTHP